MIADLPKNREIGAGWLVSFVFQCLLSGWFTKYLPALSSFSYRTPVISFEGSAGLAKIAKHSTLQVFEKAEMYNLMFEEGLDTVLPTLNQDLDFAWIDGHHEKQATLHYFDRIKPHLKKGAIVAFDDIYWSTDMLEAWEQLRQAKGFSHTIDVGVCGIGIWTGEDQSPREWSVNRFVRSGNWQPQKPAGWKQA